MTFSIYSHRHSNLYPFAGYKPPGQQNFEIRTLNNIFAYPTNFTKTTFSKLSAYLKNLKTSKVVTSEDIDPSSTIMHIDGVNILSPLPINYLEEHTNGNKIYSLLPKAFYEAFDNFIVFEEDVFDTSKTIPVGHAFKTKRHLKDVKDINFDYGCTEDSFISLKADIFNILPTFLINNNLEIPNFETIKIIDTKGTCSGSTFEYSTKTISYNKLMKKSGGFVPVLVPFSLSHLTSSASVENAYLFTFLYNIDYKKIIKYKKASLYLSTFLQKAFTSGGSYFYNEDLYNYYGSKKISSYNGLTEIQYKNAQTTGTLEKFDKYEELEYFSNPADLFKDYSLPLDFATKKRKFLDKKKQAHSYLSSEFSQDLRPFKQFKNSYNTALADLNRYETMLNNVKNIIFQKKKELEDMKKKVPSIFNNYILSYKLSSKLDQKIDQLNEEENKILETLEPSIDPYYVNIFNSIDLRRIELIDNKKNITSYSPLQNFTLTSFTKRFLTDKKIHRIVFATKTPSKINVVQNDISVVGGPYIIDVTKSRLKIALKDLTSYYGLMVPDYNRLIVHPHAGNIPYPSSDSSSEESIKLNFATACLGEASSLLYKAFENKDMKLIITSAMLWVTSANASDPWGKNYKYFTRWEEYERQTKFAKTPFEVNTAFEKYIPNPQNLYKKFVASLPDIEDSLDVNEEESLSEPESVVSQELEEQPTPSITSTVYTPLINPN